MNHWPRRIKDTPCARCGHTHHGHSRPEFGWPLQCGEWLSWFNRDGSGLATSMHFGTCDCPEWIEPPKKDRCHCGQVGRKMDTYLNGIRACSPDCAYEGERRRKVDCAI